MKESKYDLEERGWEFALRIIAASIRTAEANRERKKSR